LKMFIKSLGKSTDNVSMNTSQFILYYDLN
jgi:hypothetical protein